MLVMTLRVGDTVRLAGTVTVTVLGMEHGHVQLAIRAPRAIPVNRLEVHNRIQAERRAPGAAPPVPPDAGLHQRVPRPLLIRERRRRGTLIG